MNEFESKIRDLQVVDKTIIEAEIKKELRLQSSHRVPRGLSFWSVDLRTGEVEIVKADKAMIRLANKNKPKFLGVPDGKAKNITDSVIKTVTLDSNKYYVPAINKKNAIRKFNNWAIKMKQQLNC